MRFFKLSLSLVLIILFSCQPKEQPRDLPEVNYHDLSNLRGFNLLEKFASDWHCGPYLESDFKLIAGNGFNFIRLPIDYRCITKPGQWDLLDEGTMKDLDRAVEWGSKYGIHICINLHHAPGFCINAEGFYSADSSLWTGALAQEAFFSLWRQMAERYKGISNNQLSFNLLNEPTGTTRENYVDIAIRAVEAIYEVDPERLVMSDGWNIGSDPIPELVPYKVVQMMRGYYPMSLTHYGAGWVNNTYGPEPEWPGNQDLVHCLYSPGRSDLHAPFVLRHTFREETKVSIEILEVSGNATLEVKANNLTLLNQQFNPGKDGVTDPQFDQETGSHSGAYLKTYNVTVPAGTDSLTMLVTAGDWVTYGKVAVYNDGEENPPVNIIPGNIWRGNRPIPVVLREDNTFVTVNNMHPNWDSMYVAQQIDPWIEFHEKYDIGIMVGEWGVFHRAPQQATFAWMNYMLNTWKEHELGWAMWNFRGSFGVADSDREGVSYEEINGVKIDTAMMNLLRKFQE